MGSSDRKSPSYVQSIHLAHRAEIERSWHIGRQNPTSCWEPQIYPHTLEPFIRAGENGPQLTVGQWGLIPHFAKSAKLTYQTNNTRSGELAAKATFRQPGAGDQRPLDISSPCALTRRQIQRDTVTRLQVVARL